MSSRYFEPASIEEAAALLAEHPGADLVAGGTDLVVGDRQGKRPLGDTLVAIHRLSDLRGLSETDDGGLRIGALVTHAEIVASPVVQERWSALSDASVLVGSPATRNAGTLGGNVANGSPAMDTGSPLLVFDASVELTAATGTRSLPLVEFFEGPAKTARAPRRARHGHRRAAAPCRPGGQRLRAARVSPGHGDRRGRRGRVDRARRG